MAGRRGKRVGSANHRLSRSAAAATVSVLGLAAALFWAPYPTAFALAPERDTGQYVHRVWRASERGLPSNVVQTVLQTSDGYLWLGTESGLVRFDGVAFVTFDTDNTEQLQHNTIQCLFEDRDRNLWIGTWGGGLTRYRAGTFVTYTTADGLANDLIRNVAEDREGSIWIGTFGGGVSRLRNGEFTTFSTEDGLSSNEVRTLFADGEGDLWIGTRDGGLQVYRDGRFQTYGVADGLPSDYVTSLFEDREGTLWIGTIGGGLVAFKDGKFTSYGKEDGLASDQVSSVYEDRDGNLWVGTRGGGLSRRTNGRFTSFTTEHGLSNDLIRAILEDREGNLWVGTYGGGLNQFSNGAVVTYTTDEGLAGDLVWPIIEDREGAVWLGTWTGLSRLKDGKFTTFTTDDGLPKNAVFALEEDRDGALWVGTFGGGLARYRDGEFETFTTEDGLANDTILAVKEDSEGAVWIGSNGGGLTSYANKRFKVFTTADGLSNDIISCIQQDREGALWIGTRTGGLNRLQDGVFTVFGPDQGLPSQEVRAIHEDSAGSLWIGTRGGLARIVDGQLSAITTRHGLPDRIVYWILEDDRGNMWMSSGKGIWRVSLEQLNAVADGSVPRLQPVLYSESDGMKSAECNGGAQPAGWRTREGILWFPTSLGAAAIDPGLIHTAALPPPVYLESVIADDRAWSDQLISAAPLELGPGLEHLEIHYTALSFTAPEKNEFRYKLEGFDSEWVDAGSRRAAYYTSLPPGEYTFRVMASNNVGVWNETGASLSFSVAPYFHETYPFYGIFALTAFMLGAGVLYLRIRRMRRHQEQLEALVDARTGELAEANARQHKAMNRLEDTNELLEDTNLELARLATSDALTGVANRRSFDDTLAMEWKRHARYGRPLSLLILDVDHFKAYNDTYGHPGGDACLQKVAGALAQCVNRSEDLLARYGGEEFAALLPETPIKGARALAEAMCAALTALKLPHSASPTGSYVTASIGVACLIPEADSVSGTLVDAADEALYRAKAEGRNCIRQSGEN